MAKGQSRTALILKKYEEDLLSEWMQQLEAGGSGKDTRISQKDLRAQAKEFLSLLQQVAQTGDIDDTTGAHWKEIGPFLGGLSRRRVQQGFDSDQTATFVFSLKKPIFDSLAQRARRKSPRRSPRRRGWRPNCSTRWACSRCGRSRRRGKRSSTGSRKKCSNCRPRSSSCGTGFWPCPMIGTLDSARTQIVMESLLQRIVETGAEIAIIDITGVPTVDTLVAQHLLKTVTAIRLMGADCIISGVRPQIAQTIVHLGVDLQGVTTKANLADALALALKRSGFTSSQGKY